MTLEQLLRHRSGLPSYTDRRPDGHPDRTYEGSPTERRAAFLADALVQDPVGTPGRTFLYSNAGYAAAGHIAERAAGASWEELVERYVFAPLGMRHSGFGFPDTPLGHVGVGPELVPVPTDTYPPMEIIAPAGNIHASVADLARYASAHLAGLAGRDDFLRAGTVQRLHALPPEQDGASFASGWFVTEDAALGPVHRHAGSVGASHAEVRLYPACDSATIVLTTVSSGLGEVLADRIARALLQRYRPALPGFVSIDGERTASDVPQLAGAATAEEDARLWRVVGKLSRAINDEDREAYRSLFAPTFDQRDRDSMFDFMASNVLPSRGGIHAFHAPSAPLRVPGSERTHRPVTFHLENGFPGYFGISLDEADRIVEFSLFVKGDLCPGGTDRHCARNVKTLGEDFE